MPEFPKLDTLQHRIVTSLMLKQSSKLFSLTSLFLTCFSEMKNHLSMRHIVLRFCISMNRYLSILFHIATWMETDIDLHQNFAVNWTCLRNMNTYTLKNG